MVLHGLNFPHKFFLFNRFTCLSPMWRLASSTVWDTKAMKYYSSRFRSNVLVKHQGSEVIGKTV